MIRIKRGVCSKFKHKKLIKLSKGYKGRRKNVYRIAKQAVMKALQYSYRDRKIKKRFFRTKWIIHINYIVRIYNINYSTFINRIKNFFVNLNRKILFEILFYDELFFLKIFEIIFL